MQKLNFPLPSISSAYINETKIYLVSPDPTFVTPKFGTQLSPKIYEIKISDYADLELSFSRPNGQFLIATRITTSDLNVIEYHANIFVKNDKLFRGPWLSAAIEKQIKSWRLHFDSENIDNDETKIEITGVPDQWEMHPGTKFDDLTWVIPNMREPIELAPPIDIKKHPVSVIPLTIIAKNSMASTALPIIITIPEQLSLHHTIFYQSADIKLPKTNDIIIISDIPAHTCLCSGVQTPDKNWIITPSDTKNGIITIKYFKPLGTEFQITISLYNSSTMEKSGEIKKQIHLNGSMNLHQEQYCNDCGIRKTCSIFANMNGNPLYLSNDLPSGH